MGLSSFFVFLATISAISHQVSGLHIPNLIRQPIAKTDPDPEFSCLSWQFGAETNNIRDWETVPKVCEEDVKIYMSSFSSQYEDDSKAVVLEAFLHAENLKLAGDGKEIWIFDIDETSLSNLEYYAQYGYGTDPIDKATLFEWINKSKASALQESLNLYKILLGRGIKIVFLTGRPEDLRNVTEGNLKNAGYQTWEKLILRESSYWDNTTNEYKSNERKKLEERGYIIVGNIGDQWSDLLGAHPGNRTFKLPNPMYYVS